ncbi:MAG TPA: hypothetical protein DEB31_02350 [Clostridiales bacterium]|nr:hypothetical protein [Clostridiales bacterium]
MDDANRREAQPNMEYLKARLLIAEAEAARQEAALRDCKQARDRINAELAEVYRSRRWRLTEPLAKAKQLFFGNRQAPIIPPGAGGLCLKQPAVLVVDRHIPMEDRDAGSRSMFQYICLLREMGYPVVCLGADFEAPQPYASALERRGVTILSGEYYARHWREWVLQNKKHIALAVFSRPGPAYTFQRFVRENTKARAIYFGMDLQFLREQRAIDAGDRTVTERQLEETRATEFVVMSDADAVLLFSDKEVEIVRREFHIRAQAAPLFFYQDVPKRETPFGGTKNLLFVGGFAHKPNVDGILWFITKVFPLIQRELPDICLDIVGSGPPRELLGLAEDRIRVRGFLEEQALAGLYHASRLCVVPLRYGAGVKGKLVEAAYYGTPIVSTAIGMEGLPDIDKIMRPADTAEQFAAQVVEKYTDGREWEKERTALQNYVAKYFSYAGTKRMMEKLIDSLNSD